jgi:hypothetical protein
MCYTTIADEADKSMKNMSKIAKWGDGFFYHRPNVSYTYYDIQSLLNSIRETFPAEDKRGVIEPNAIVNIPFIIDSKSHDFKTYLSFGKPLTSDNVSITLTSPSDIEYGDYTFFEVMNRLDVSSSEAGTWLATIENNSMAPVQYCFGVDVTSDIRIDVSKVPLFKPIDTPFLVTVSLKDYIEPILGASLSVTVSRDSWSKCLVLCDNGSNGDLVANDGIYSTYIYIYNEVIGLFSPLEGVYNLTFLINSQPMHISRSIRRHIYLSPQESSPYPEVTRLLHRGWNWVGYPRLDDRVRNTIEYANLSLVPYLEGIDSSHGTARYIRDQWIYQGLTSIDKSEGYKLKIEDIDRIELYELGILVDTLAVHELREGEWNWLTYPCYETVKPLGALSDVKESIDFIMAEDWSMMKDGDDWIIDGAYIPCLGYGESIMVRATQDCSFVWNANAKINRTRPPRTKHFTYEDEPNYETIMIESIEGNPSYSEIGVFQDNECIGARVFEAYPIQILAYSDTTEEGGGSLSFALYSEGKGITTVVPTSFDSTDLNTNQLTLNPMYLGFRQITLKMGVPQLPIEFTLHSIHPNPFNPSTTIDFSIPTTAQVKLTIYNVKGQRVKVLLNRTLELGRHSIVWDGKDGNNRAVSSGVYFTRLEHQGNVKTHKMVLMK